jgi:site-specific DNA-adenine methylase
MCIHYFINQRVRSKKYEFSDPFFSYHTHNNTMNNLEEKYRQLLEDYLELKIRLQKYAALDEKHTELTIAYCKEKCEKIKMRQKCDELSKQNADLHKDIMAMQEKETCASGGIRTHDG